MSDSIVVYLLIPVLSAEDCRELCEDIHFAFPQAIHTSPTFDSEIYFEAQFFYTVSA